MKKVLFSLVALTFLSSCALFEGDGQVVFHWERPNTGIQKFARDHNACMHEAEDFKLLPRFKTLFHSIFYSEEEKLAVRADWDAKRGIWASYIPYNGAQPLIVNYLRDDTEISPSKYKKCMIKSGYTIRYHDIPVITNIRLHQ